ncbi:MAG: FtsQ-type POTRA domain-containing protein [Chloroflexota bacterium]|nr:FtsQ-type POTRA domain-containing protein [Chloroflexota bacterium]
MTQRPAPRRSTVARPAARRATAAAPLRRTRPIRRASAGLSPVRAGAMLALLLSASAIYGVANSAAFRYEELRLEGAAVTDPTAVEAALEVARDENLFLLRTGPLSARLAALSTVRDATVAVELPSTLVVDLREREPILIWRVGERRYLVDVDGNLFALLDDDPPAETLALPVVEDRRAASAGLSVGRTLDAVDLDAATRLASIIPSDVGSEAESLAVQVTDASGYVVRARPTSWTAIFGFYTPSLRTPELVPGQVRLLRSLLIGREHLVERVVLGSETDGTYVAKPTPTPTPTPKP